jgi:HK97 gp10 family phage protein
MIEVKEDPKNQRTYLKIENMDDSVRRGIRHGFFSFGKDLQSEANREILRKPKSGRTYVRKDRSGRKRRHIASAPGETHANMSGKLRRAIGWKIHGWKSMNFGYGIDKESPDYDKFVEFGTSRMEPRPSLQNAIRKSIRNAVVGFEREIIRFAK